MAEIDQNDDKRLDALLDSMLAGYSAVEPRPGLERRLLTSIREAKAKQTSPKWMWRWISLGTTAAAAAVIAFLLWSSPASRKQPGPMAQWNPGSEQVAAPHVANTAPHHALTPPQSARVARIPGIMRAPQSEARKEVFPTPEPLSDQERLLVRYLSRTPREELVAQSHIDLAPDEDLLQGPQGVFSPTTNSRNSGNSN